MKCRKSITLDCCKNVKLNNSIEKDLKNYYMILINAVKLDSRKTSFKPNKLNRFPTTINESAINRDFITGISCFTSIGKYRFCFYRIYMSGMDTIDLTFLDD